MLSSDFHCRENDGKTGAAHLIQTYLAISTDIRRVRSLANYRSLVFAKRICHFIVFWLSVLLCVIFSFFNILIFLDSSVYSVDMERLLLCEVF